MQILENRLITLTGPGGNGKTRLAIKAGRALLGSFEHGVWFIDLTGVLRDSGVAGAVSRVLGILEEAGTALSQTIARQLENRSILLVLDNCEQVLAGSADFSAAVLANSPHVKIVATSREPLRIRGELVSQIPPLSIDDGENLFYERGLQSGGVFSNGYSESTVIRTIVKQLDCVPLAIELAAARSPMMDPEQILAGLDRRFDLLNGGVRDASARSRSLRASVVWSYDLMSPEEKAMARRLSVLRGFTLEAATAIGGGTAPLDQLQRLVEMSIVQVDRSGPQRRYRFLETVREYLLEQLVENGEVLPARSAHLAHFIDFSEFRAEHLILGDGPILMAQIQTEFDNLEDALIFAESLSDPSALLRLLTALTGYYEIWGQHQHGMRWFDTSLARTRAPDVLVARAYWGASHVSAYGGRMDLAFPRAMRALELAREIDDPWTESRALDIIGFAQAVSDPKGARESLSRCIELGRQINDGWAETHGIKMITVVYLFSHHVAGGSETIQNLLLLADETESRYLRAWGSALKGYFARDAGDFSAARDSLDISIESASYVGDPATGGFAKAWSAALKADNGWVDEARREMQDMMQTATATGTFLAVPETMFQLGLIEVGAGNPQATIEMIGDHTEDLKSAGIPVWAAQLALANASAHIALGKLDEANALLDEAEELAASLDNPLLSGLNFFFRGQLSLAKGDLGAAEGRLHQALEIQRDAALLPGLLRTMEAISSVLIAKEKGEDAARILTFVDQARLEIQLERSSVELARRSSQSYALENLLGISNLEKMQSKAKNADLEEIIGLMSRMRGKRARPLTGWDSLTPTERRVVSLTTAGLSNPQIAERMFIARGTVKVHLSHIYEKLDVASRTQLAAKAVADGFEVVN
ncbi:Signal transduction response regulator [Candidatus Rhodobacter oscarellae]|uniref:Signal transduction response regulator n=2 Tax=Candidatus Rhodobacter oscarellae TaxID=1675527 RepID=A0A0J9E6N3_9RHOB|nr:Signal transduction response regulator [Candidatus Rhodobacter lobularis]